MSPAGFGQRYLKYILFKLSAALGGMIGRSVGGNINRCPKAFILTIFTGVIPSPVFISFLFNSRYRNRDDRHLKGLTVKIGMIYRSPPCYIDHLIAIGIFSPISRIGLGVKVIREYHSIYERDLDIRLNDIGNKNIYFIIF